MPESKVRQTSNSIDLIIVIAEDIVTNYYSLHLIISNAESQNEVVIKDTPWSFLRPMIGSDWFFGPKNNSKSQNTDAINHTPWSF